MKIIAAVAAKAKEDFVICPLELDEPRDDELLVKIVATGICHTDLVVRDQILPVPMPVVLGHEGAGIVQKVGRNISHLKPGDKVVLSVGSCGHCEPCATGLQVYCHEHQSLNWTGARTDGTVSLHDGKKDVHSHFFGQSSFANFAVVNKSSVIKVPDDAPLEALGPFACGIMTGAGAVMNSLTPEPGTSIAIFGIGAVGIAAIAAAKVMGCTTIIAVDVQDGRLNLAKEIGATHVVNSKKQDPVKTIYEITAGKGAHYAVECSGLPTVMKDAVNSLQEVGACVLTGVPSSDTPLSLEVMHLLRGRVVRGSIMGDASPSVFIPKLVELFLEGRFPVDKMYQYYPLADINMAIADTHAGTTIKAILTMPH
ncbi:MULTISPECIES: NAD(P)-dependent alcohol dehydrogenase [Serratia]|uniref:NAD(P)-dependent alcohol dehydrogenase n=1 Tax=Serratia TaxID=613 RepID=UPI001F4C141A|nr:NAD(P)-dependent alcohol dehydrogenase [Serratia proteamaculans]ULG15650.1 NAD(P)-dependent alcohol dehydrogenase [Serratia proteamaculans]